MTRWVEEYARGVVRGVERWGGVVATLAILAFTICAFLFTKR